jgi:hypothetical protein
VLQLYASDAPDLPFPPGTDLLQLLWCPYDHEPYCAQARATLDPFRTHVPKFATGLMQPPGHGEILAAGPEARRLLAEHRLGGCSTASTP